MPPLEDAMPPQWIVWASNVPPTPQLAEVARKCLCFNPFSVTALLEDLVTVWKRHDGKGCDANASSGEVRSLLQRRYIESLRVAELPPIDDAIADRIMVVAMNFAIDGNTYKATGDRLIHAFIESRLDTSALASIPNNQPPYAENAKEATAEATIKEVGPPQHQIPAVAHTPPDHRTSTLGHTGLL